MFVGGMSLQADEARAKIINCEALDDKQKAKMLLLINTEPNTTLPVFTGVPDFLRETSGTIDLYAHAYIWSRGQRHLPDSRQPKPHAAPQTVGPVSNVHKAVHQDA
ncbi:TPA: hypothetical protein ACH3X2_004010 [Trebouxia sp. C0005]